ncbi:SRPBCC family protein [Dankookia sp. GCM10030260]|uniref:SRPBCC family protein n=1 Tax=Dankookia sp. GCM10030260 TaxID=3273390 RepID=UPI003615CBC0
MARYAASPACPSITVEAGEAPTPDAAALSLLSRPEEAFVPVVRERFAPWFVAAPLETLLPGAAGIPAVTGTRPLSAAPFPKPGSRRLVCLADGSTAMEEVLEHEPGRRLRYIVWGYTTPAAAPIAYGVGEFRFADAAEGTAVHWTYSFALKEDRFPGSLGALGRGLFRLAFLDTRYSRFMASGMRAIGKRAIAELDGAAEQALRGHRTAALR